MPPTRSQSKEAFTDSSDTSAGIYRSGEIRLLVIDDDPAIGRLVQAVLAGREFNIHVVSDPLQVTATLRASQHHVVILDFVIPGLDAFGVLNLVQDTQPSASVIVVTANPSIDTATPSTGAHTIDYLSKPFQVDALRTTILRRLETRGLLRLSEEALREQLGAVIRERRKALGLTLAEMAKRTEVSLGYLSQIELGKNSASVETLYRIALGLNLRLADLFQSVGSTS